MFGKPKWQSKSWQKRLQGVAELSDQQILGRIAHDDPEHSVRYAALQRITDQKILLEMVCDPGLKIEQRLNAAYQFQDKQRLMQLWSQTTEGELMLIIALKANTEDILISTILTIGNTPDTWRLFSQLKHLRSFWEIRQRAADNRSLQGVALRELQRYCHRKEKDFDHLPKRSKDYILRGKDLLVDDYCEQAVFPDFLHDYEAKGRETTDGGLSDDDDMKAHKYTTYQVYRCKVCGYEHHEKVDPASL